jgi:hypothetical protein
MSFYNHGNDDFDGVYMGGDPNGPVLANTATKVVAEPVDAGFPAGSPENKPFDGFHEWSLVDTDGAGGAVPRVRLNGEDFDPVAEAIPAPSMFPAGTVGWGTLNPNESGFFQTKHIVFEASEALPGDTGDFDGDGTVDGDDLVQWKGDFGVNGDSDADGDGDSDGNDFLIWQRTLGPTPPGGATPAVTGVPEPQSLALLVGAVGVLAGRRRRK